MISAVIFDLDGLLADTEPLHCRAYQLALAERGVALDAGEYYEHWVQHGYGIVDWIAWHNLDLDPHALRQRKSQHYLALLESSLRPMDGALELLDGLNGKIRIALASSSYRDAIDGVLAGLKIARYFEVIVSGQDVAKVKPAPDIYFYTANALAIEPAQCVVLEDAEKGVIAAQLAGMRSIAVPNEFTRHHDFSSATRVCASLREVNLDFLRGLEQESPQNCQGASDAGQPRLRY
jgi:HAD superfamily hydrolase (TIGR01509 family)